MHKRTDQLGYRLRGEPEPARPWPPERAYRWIQHSTLSVAATVTVVTGATAEDVLRAFGADPDRPDSLQQISDDVIARTAALDGLDFDDYRDSTGKGLVAVQRFTGHGITAEDLERIEAADVAFRIPSNDTAHS